MCGARHLKNALSMAEVSTGRSIAPTRELTDEPEQVPISPGFDESAVGPPTHADPRDRYPSALRRYVQELSRVSRRWLPTCCDGVVVTELRVDGELDVGEGRVQGGYVANDSFGSLDRVTAVSIVDEIR